MSEVRRAHVALVARSRARTPLDTATVYPQGLWSCCCGCACIPQLRAQLASEQQRCRLLEQQVRDSESVHSAMPSPLRPVGEPTFSQALVDSGVDQTDVIAKVEAKEAFWQRYGFMNTDGA